MFLVQDWSLDFKPSSCKIISSRKRDRLQSVGKYAWACPFPVLGSLIGPCGSPWEDWHEAERAAWRRFWSGAGSRKAKGLRMGLKVRDIQRVAWPAISSRCSWWPIGSSLASCIGGLQRSMFSCVLRLPRESFECDADYARRRGRESRKWCAEVGLWEELAANRVVSWFDHVDRAHCRSWATRIQPVRGSAWLQAQRVIANSWSMFAGILASREVAGRPRVRWEEAVDRCRQIVKP